MIYEWVKRGKEGGEGGESYLYGCGGGGQLR